ncbi:MAG: hypothetical protein HFK10_06670 [Clostridia bacterium]|jgi:hypothetical protein|nr:hypothetical protein [Clostridia bacterium]
MKTLQVGDTWHGKSHVDMINLALGADYAAYMRCTVPLKRFGGCGTAWFVYMDGSVHGHRDEYLWMNTLSPDGTTIVERCVSDDKSYVRALPFTEQDRCKLAFRLDPEGTNDRFACSFVGYFRLEHYDTEHMVRTYTRIAETYTLQ